MEVSDYLKKYRELDNYFAPDYGQENEVLAGFKMENPTLSETQILAFKNILESDRPIHDKYFVADLLYLYIPFSYDLVDPLVNCAIATEDPSFNRIFIRPCIMSFGIDKVNNLVNQKAKADISRMAGIKRLEYWLHPPENWI